MFVKDDNKVVLHENELFAVKHPHKRISVFLKEPWIPIGRKQEKPDGPLFYWKRIVLDYDGGPMLSERYWAAHLGLEVLTANYNAVAEKYVEDDIAEYNEVTCGDFEEIFAHIKKLVFEEIEQANIFAYTFLAAQRKPEGEQEY